MPEYEIVVPCDKRVYTHYQLEADSEEAAEAKLREALQQADPDKALDVAGIEEVHYDEPHQAEWDVEEVRDADA